MNFVFVSPDGSACPESFWSARARSVPFTLAVRGCDGGRLPEADTQEKGITGENDDVHTRTYRPFSCTGETALQRPGGRVKKALTTSVLPL
ncbi:hypothetical protein P4906_23050 [Escherichia coli]